MDSDRCSQMTILCKWAIIVRFCIQVDRGGGGVVGGDGTQKRRCKQ